MSWESPCGSRGPGQVTEVSIDIMGMRIIKRWALVPTKEGTKASEAP